MVTVFSDTETTGLEPINSGPHEIAMLVYNKAQFLAEKVFYLNPLDNEVLYHQDSYKAHGISEEQIRSYPPAAQVIPEIVDFLKPFCPPEKFVFGGYNAGFDYGHISGILFRHGVQMRDYFSGRLIDVLELVKKADSMGLLPETVNKKLGTMTKSLGIPHEKAHSALSDIRATRQLYEYLYQKSKEGEKK